MPIISVEIMKTTHQREMQKATKEKQTKTERSKRNRSYSERVRAKWFCFSFKLGFLQLTCKASLILKSNLELALSISIGKNKKTKKFLMKLSMINCILLALLLLVSMVLIKCINSPLVIHLLNFVGLFHLQILLMIILPPSFVIFFQLQFLMTTLPKILSLLFLKLRMQILRKNILFSTI